VCILYAYAYKANRGVWTWGDWEIS
jgi:hypothetical protein